MPMARTLFAPVGSNEPREQIPADSYPARLISFIYLGTQPWSVQYPTPKIKARFTFEFPTEKRVFNEEKWEQPFVVSREFTLSMWKQSNLLPFVEWMIGKKLDEEDAKTFDILSLVGQAYFATIIHNDKWYADIQGIVKLPKAMTCPDQINPTQIVLEEDWKTEWEKLPTFIQDKIKKSAEYRGKWAYEQKNSDPREVNDEISIEDIPF